MNEKKMEQEYREFIREVNRDPPHGDEYGCLAARDALTEAYGLGRYPRPPESKRRERAATAAHSGGFFAPYQRGVPPCRE